MERVGRNDRGLKWWLLTFSITIVLLAGLQWIPRYLHQPSKENLMELSKRIALLEGEHQIKQQVIVLIDSEQGGLGSGGKTRSFMTSGGSIAAIVSGSASSEGSDVSLDIAIQIDGVDVGHLKAVSSERGTHKRFSTGVFSLPGLSAGSHTLQLTNGNPLTVTDTSDSFTATVIEFGCLK